MPHRKSKFEPGGVDKFVGNKFERPQAGPKGGGQDARSNPGAGTNPTGFRKFYLGDAIPGNRDSNLPGRVPRPIAANLLHRVRDADQAPGRRAVEAPDFIDMG
jgi:hypothetical protein